jgi:hypothetical protein
MVIILSVVPPLVGGDKIIMPCPTTLVKAISPQLDVTKITSENLDFKIGVW